MNNLLLRLLTIACALLVFTVGPSATLAAEQAGHSPIYSFDVMHKGEVAGEVKINTAKKAPSYVLRAEGLAPGMNYMFWYQGATAEALYLLGYQGTTRSGRLSMSGTFPDASLEDLQAAQFWFMPEPGLGSIEPGHKYLSAGGGHTLAVTCDGAVYVWGDDANYECGPWPQNDMWKVPVPLLLETLPPGVVEAASGDMHSMVLMSDGTVYAWGNNAVGQLGVGDKDTSSMPQQVHGPGNVGYLTGITRLAAGYEHSLAVKDDGTLWAWGSNGYGRLGIGAYDEHHTVPYQVHGPDDAGFLTDVVEAAAGDQHSLALRSDGTVYAFGYNLSGQLGSGDLNYYYSPHQVHGPGNAGFLTGIKKVAAGANFSLALRDDGTLWSWGEGGRGQLGLHSNNDHTVPYQVHGPENVGFLTDVVDIAAGDRHSLALKSDGTVWAWGEGGSGQLGVHSNNDHTVPYQVHGPGNVGFLCGIIAVAAGDEFSLALKDDGTVWAWGEGEDGQLGINEYYVHTDCDHTVPYQVHGPGNVGYLTGIGPTCIPASGRP